jgi:DNA-binding SARP family transcriptional activator
VRRIVQRYALPAPPDAGERWPWLIRVRTLGGFSIERDGAPATAARKESRKPLDLLKLVIALGGEAVPVARLCAALWPEAEGDAARNSFDNTLHRLRKLLGGDRHVPLRAGGLGLDAATCWTDLAALETCFAAIDKLAPSADTAQILALAERALGLWRGEFLAGEDDLHDVLAARTRIQAKFTRQMGALGIRLEAIGQHAAAVRLYQRVVEQQPLAEDIYRRLISCMLALEQRGEAYEVYRRCRQQLSVLLGIAPAPETEALVASLRNLQ